MNGGAKALLTVARQQYHARLIASGVLNVSSKGIASNADKSSALSVKIALDIARALASETGERLAGQKSGSQFETANAEFIKGTFLRLSHLRPGKWTITKSGNGGRNRRIAISNFEQYAHLRDLEVAARANPALAASLGNDYMIHPDVVIVRQTMNDAEINAEAPIVDGEAGLRSSIRERPGGHALLHASISSKWTIRSDRSQNSRAEALNLIRNRKGHLPHIVVVTGEPLPSRLVSIALGTGDIDCVYHFALAELMAAVKACGEEDAWNMLNTMVVGKRLKDISDLPLDLAV